MPAAMKILMTGFTTKTNHTNGYDIHVASILHELSKGGEQISYISIGIDNYQYNTGILPHHLKFIRRLSPYFTIKNLLSFHEKKPDIIHMQGIGITPGLFAYILFKGQAKKILTIHGFSSDEMVAHGLVKKDSSIHNFIKRVEHQAIKSSDLVITVDREKENRIAESYQLSPETHLITIPNGFDDRLFNPSRFSQLDKALLRKKIETGLDDILILEAKGLQTNNGQDMLIRSMVHIAKRYSNAKLILVGDGPEMDYLKGLAKDLGVYDNIRFLGNLPNEEIPGIIHACDICVLPSCSKGGVHEGSSVFLMESMAMGKVVIASNVGGNIDSISDGITGLLFNESSIEDFEKKLFQIIESSSLRNNLSTNARNYVQRRSWANVASELKKQYTLALNN